MGRRKWQAATLAGAVVASTLAVTVPALAASGSGGTERFTIVQTSPTGHTFPISATGPIHALGKDTPGSNNKDTFAFPKGALIVQHSRTAGTQNFDKATCLGTFTEQGVYKVLSGTGAYAHATGHGTYSLAGYAFGCSQNKPPSTFSLVIKAAGPLSLGG
jgi:hypothetical protein